MGQNLSEFRTIKARDIDAAGKKPALDANGQPIIGADGNPLTVAQAYQLNPNQVGYGQVTGEAYDTYTTLQKRWGNGGAGTIILSAIAGAASGNVTGTGTEFAQNAVINVVRQYTATEIKRVADSLQNVDPVTGVRTNSLLSELVRGALHAMASCGGASAVGGSCRDAAGAAAATVALNNLLIRKDVGTLTEAQKLAYSNLIQTIVTGAATGLNLDAVSGQQAAKFELENNQLLSSIRNYRTPRRYNNRSVSENDFATSELVVARIEAVINEIRANGGRLPSVIRDPNAPYTWSEAEVYYKALRDVSPNNPMLPGSMQQSNITYIRPMALFTNNSTPGIASTSSYSEAMANLKNAGFSSRQSGNAVTLTRGNITYSFYPASSSTNSYSCTIYDSSAGKATPVQKIRFANP